MTGVRCDTVGIVFNLFTRRIEQIIVPTGDAKANKEVLDRHQATSVTPGCFAMVRMPYSQYNSFKSERELTNSLMLKSDAGG